jgi:hypothetical protein
MEAAMMRAAQAIALSQDKAADAISALVTEAKATDASITGTLDVPELPAIVTDNRALVLQPKA